MRNLVITEARLSIRQTYIAPPPANRKYTGVKTHAITFLFSFIFLIYVCLCTDVFVLFFNLICPIHLMRCACSYVVVQIENSELLRILSIHYVRVRPISFIVLSPAGVTRYIYTFNRRHVNEFIVPFVCLLVRLTDYSVYQFQMNSFFIF